MPSAPQPKFQPWPDSAQLESLANSFTSFGEGKYGAAAVNPFLAPDRCNPKFVRWLYDRGFAGAVAESDASRESRQRLAKQRSGFTTVAEAAHAFQFADSGAGKLVIPWVWQLILFPGSEPGAAQERGDCVSHASSGAQRLSMVCDIIAGKPDEKSGMIEGVPDVDPVGIKEGITSSEWCYWWRGYNGDGWSCGTAAEVAMRHGVALRNNYPDLGIDLRNYSGSLAGKYGSRSPSEQLDAAFKVHPVHSVLDANSFEEVRDALANGFGVQSCGGEGFSSKRDQWGYSPRSGGWSHGYKNPGGDDREVAKRQYGDRLILNFNNWGVWNGGPRDIIDSARFVPQLRALAKALAPWQAMSLEQLDIVNPATGNIMIPPGAWWCKWSEANRRDYHVYAGVGGWKRRALPNWGGSLAG